jgi:hypothetical protein
MSKIIATIVILGVIVLVVRTAQAQSKPVSEAAYWDQVQHTLDVATSLVTADTNTLRSTLDGEAEAFKGIGSIALANGTTIPIDNSYLVSLLQQDPPDLDQIQSYLTLLVEAHNLPVTLQPESGPSLAEILARPEFQWEQQKPNPIQEWIDNMIARILDALIHLFPGTSIPVGLRPLVTIGGIILLALILGFALRGFLFDMVSAAELPSDTDEAGIPLTAASALQRAQDNAAAGDYRTAVRFLYLSTLLQMEEHGLFRYDRARTNREYLRSVAHLPELAAILRDVVDVFDRVWYGYQTIDEAAFQSYVARVTELRQYR